MPGNSISIARRGECGIVLISGISSNSYGYQIPESQIERPEGFQGSSKDAFVRDDKKEMEAEKSFRQMGELFLSHKHKAHHKHDHRQDNRPQMPSGSISGPKESDEVSADEVCMFPNREGYRSDFLGVDYPMPTLGDSIKDKASHLIGKPDEIELKYTHFSVVQNKERRQCFFTACNIDGTQSKNIKRSGSWVIDGRIPREDQLGNEAYADNDLDKGHMVRRLDPAWGSSAALSSSDTFVYTNAAMQHANLNQKSWLDLENHVLGSAKGQKMTVLTGPVFSETDRPFNNGGRVNPPTQIPEKFWKVVVWKDEKSNQLKGAAFVLSQSDILDRDGGLFKGGFEPGRFGIYQVPISQLEDMTDLHFAPVTDITKQACELTSADGYTPQGL